MTQGKALQSEAGNLTLLAYGKNELLIWVAKSDGAEASGDFVGYITDNPTTSDRAIDVEFDTRATQEEIRHEVDSAIMQAKIDALKARTIGEVAQLVE